MRSRVRKFAATLVAGVAIFWGNVPAAHAIDIFGYKFFEPEPPAGSITYKVDYKVEPADEEILDHIKQSSLLENQLDTPPADVEALITRARADEQRLIGALYGIGYYGGAVNVAIAGQPVSLIEPGSPPRLPPNPVPIEVTVQPGPRFEFGSVKIVQPQSPDGTISSNPADYNMRPGRVARSANILGAEQQLVNAWRDKGYPLARISRRDVVADHATRKLDVELVVDPGPRATFGQVTIEGSEGVDTEFIRRLVQIEPGEIYSPQAVIRARDRLRALNTFNQVRMIEAEQLTPEGQLPLTIQLEDRKPRYVGASASYSTIDGGEVAAYWGHRNLFGEAERLRIDVKVKDIASTEVDDYTYELKAEFVKPAVYGVDTDFVTDVSLFHEHPDNDSYRAYGVRGKVGFAHRFSDELSGTLSAEGQFSHADDAFGERDYKLLGLNGFLSYDRRNDVMNPTHGYRVFGRVNPLVDLGRGDIFSVNRIDAAAYYPLDKAERYVVAGRVALGSIFGTDLEGVPPERRFYAGGGGSLRGYAYQNVSPRRNGKITGGRGLFEASLELRAKVTKSIGIVPFVDFATVSSDALPGLGDTVNKVGTGLGFRYYTAIGPIRLDLAVPLQPGKGDPDFGMYIGLGQSF